MRVWGLLLGSVSASTLSFATDSPPQNTAEAKQPATLLACMALDNNVERLDCYDTALNRQITPQVLPASTLDPDVALDRLSATPNSAQPQAMPVSLGDVVKQEPLSYNPQVSLLDRRWELSDSSKLGTFNLRAYKPVYVLPLFYSGDVNERPQSPNPLNQVAQSQQLDALESKFQISFKTKAIEGDFGDLWLGYTQSSRWQVYNNDRSRPFRETNYEPEASLILATNYSILGWHGRLLGVSLNHQSNGRAQPFSRSWNRAILNVGFERTNWVVMLRPWYRFSEDANQDDNHDIDDYMGHGDLQVVYKWRDQEISALLRHNLKSDDPKGAIGIDWSLPIHGSLRGFVQIFDGYGESLIDYNHRATYVGAGISLLNWY